MHVTEPPSAPLLPSHRSTEPLRLSDASQAAPSGPPPPPPTTMRPSPLVVPSLTYSLRSNVFVYLIPFANTSERVPDTLDRGGKNAHRRNQFSERQPPATGHTHTSPTALVVYTYTPIEWRTTLLSMPQEDSSEPSSSAPSRTPRLPLNSSKSYKRLPDLIVEELRPWGVVNKFSCIVSDCLKKPK